VQESVLKKGTMGSRYNTLNKFMGAYLHPPSRQVFGLILFGSAHFFRHFGNGYLVIQETRVLKTQLSQTNYRLPTNLSLNSKRLVS
jgi:hypothetical protein